MINEDVQHDDIDNQETFADYDLYDTLNDKKKSTNNNSNNKDFIEQWWGILIIVLAICVITVVVGAIICLAFKKYKTAINDKQTYGQFSSGYTKVDEATA